MRVGFLKSGGVLPPFPWLSRPVKIGPLCVSPTAVLITAAGLQGEKPLAQLGNVGKGSRQVGSVRSLERLARGGGDEMVLG